MSNKNKLLEIKTSKLVNSPFVGNYKTNFKGTGLEFADFKEYKYGDDVKNIDFLKSSSEGTLLIKQYEEERELTVYFVVDLSESFEFSFGGKSKIDILKEVLYILGFSSIKSQDKIGLYLFNKNYNKLNIAKKGKANFISIIDTIDSSIVSKKKCGGNNNKQGLNYFNSLNINKSLVFFLTDKNEIDEKQLKILSTKNDLVLINIFHSIENNLEGLKGNLNFIDGINNFFVNFNDNAKKEEFRKIREYKINKLKKTILKLGSRYLYLDEKSNIFKDLLLLMKK